MAEADYESYTLRDMDYNVANYFHSFLGFLLLSSSYRNIRQRIE